MANICLNRFDITVLTIPTNRVFSIVQLLQLKRNANVVFLFSKDQKNLRISFHKIAVKIQADAVFKSCFALFSDNPYFCYLTASLAFNSFPPEDDCSVCKRLLWNFKFVSRLFASPDIIVNRTSVGV